MNEDGAAGNWCANQLDVIAFSFRCCLLLPNMSEKQYLQTNINHQADRQSIPTNYFAIYNFILQQSIFDRPNDLSVCCFCFNWTTLNKAHRVGVSFRSVKFYLFFYEFLKRSVYARNRLCLVAGKNPFGSLRQTVWPSLSEVFNWWGVKSWAEQNFEIKIERLISAWFRF